MNYISGAANKKQNPDEYKYKINFKYMFDIGEYNMCCDVIDWLFDCLTENVKKKKRW